MKIRRSLNNVRDTTFSEHLVTSLLEVCSGLSYAQLDCYREIQGDNRFSVCQVYLEFNKLRV